MDNIIVNNITELKNRKGSINTKVFVSGYYTNGDNGGGFFYWDNLSTEIDNGGTIISVININIGRWKRVINTNDINVKWFGAKGDGVADDYSSIQSTINFSRIKKNKIIISEGLYYVSTALELYNGIIIEGIEYKTTKGADLSYEPVSCITGLNRNGYLMTYSSSIEPSIASYAFIDSVNIKNVGFTNCEYYFGSTDLTKYLANVTFDSCNFYASCKTAIIGNFILGRFIDCFFGYFGDSTAFASFKQLDIGGTSTLPSNSNYFESCRFNRATGSEGIILGIGHKMLFNNCLFEGNNNTTRYMLLNGFKHLKFKDCWIEYNKGVVIFEGNNDSHHILFDACLFVTGKTNSYIVATYHPDSYFAFSNCYFLDFCKFLDGGGSTINECRLTLDGNSVVDGSIKTFENNYIIQKTRTWDGITESGTLVSTQSYPYEVKDLYKGRREVFGTTAPTTGTWSVGDIVYNTAPTSGSYIGWVCTVAGTAGTWNGFGLIA